MQDFEKLGIFYLGRGVPSDNAGENASEPELLLYDSKDMVTHGVCVGMTGSGKTGLCIGFIEEAAIDGIPVIAIDPKGDIPNLHLTFPNLDAASFQPWINPEDARRKGMSDEEYAAAQADLWKRGLASWGQDGNRIRKLREAAEVVTFTPGSTAGIPVSVLKSFSTPSPEVINDGELLAERVATAASSLLGLAGIMADPMQSREHILLSTIFETAWKEGRDLDLTSIILALQNPPVSRIGVLDIESFFPAKDRFTLAMALNNLLASPSFSSWMEGVPLDIPSILYTPTGKPRVSIFYLAHLADNERMFFVSLLLNQIVSWMRSQPGTTSLRALVYMDEIFGYFPPTANPPSKKPLLTLLKQARAYGVGVLLATQNPVDLDYKGLSNTGTWLIGRLQTERDKLRIMDALEGASAAVGAAFDKTKLGTLISGLGNRIFLLHNTHEDAPVVFESRWVMSYLRGPLSRDQIKKLTDPLRPSFVSAKFQVTAPAAGVPPVLPPDISQSFVPVRIAAQSGSQLHLLPALLGAATAHVVDSKLGVDTNIEIAVAAKPPADPGADPWEEAMHLTCSISELDSEPPAGAYFAQLPESLMKPKNFQAWQRALVSWVYRSAKVELFKSPSSGAVSKPEENERDFRVRLAESFREERDRQVDLLRKKYAAKIAAHKERVARAQATLEREKSQAKSQKLQGMISFGTAILGGLLGARKLSATNVGRVATSARGIGRTMQAEDDVRRAKEAVESREQTLFELEEEMNRELAALTSKIDPLTETFETLALRPKKTEISPRTVRIIWLPHWRSTDGKLSPAWE